MDRKKIKIAVLAAASGLLILAAGGITAKMVQDRKTAAIETARMERETKDKEKEEERRNAANEDAKEQDDKIMGFSAESAKRVKETLGMRPPLVELTEENRREFARIASCRIDGEKGKIVIEASAEGIPVSCLRWNLMKKRLQRTVHIWSRSTRTKRWNSRWREILQEQKCPVNLWWR